MKNEHRETHEGDKENNAKYGNQQKTNQTMDSVKDKIIIVFYFSFRGFWFLIFIINANSLDSRHENRLCNENENRTNE